MTARLLAATGSVGIIAGATGVALVNVPLFAIGGIVAAIAGLAWGFTVHGEPEPRRDTAACPACDHPLGHLRHSCIAGPGESWTFPDFAFGGDDPPRRDANDPRPVWDPDLMGAPE